MNETYKIISDFEIQRDHLISIRKEDCLFTKKKKKRKEKENLPSSRFCRCSGSQSEKKRKPKDGQILEPCQRTENVVEHESDRDSNCIWCRWNDSQRVGKRTGKIENQRKNRDYPDYNIVKIGKNTQNAPGDQRDFQSIRRHWKTIVFHWSLCNNKPPQASRYVPSI